ncbi:putative molybdenum cofactor guanylyltransferase [bacterium BMS3Abin03]|nr:putative molybdenum cofactor guanylyltransferase [bacterium BMS3Abin03]
MYNDITGIILSGGKSSRMGENKSLMKIDGVTVIERVVNLMLSLFSKVILITNSPNDYKFLKLPIYKDIYPYRGPLAGIHSGLYHSTTNINFIISCDIPLMIDEMIKYIIEFNTDKPINICKADGFIQQLVGLYSKSVLPAAEKLLLESTEEESRHKKQTKRKCKVLSLIDVVGAEIIDAEKLQFYKEDIFFNMNKPEDYYRVLKIISSN